MSTISKEVEAACEKIANEYSACDVSDALLKLKVAGAGFLPDISPILSHEPKKTFVAPISTVHFVPKSHTPGTSYPNRAVPAEQSIHDGFHWTDYPAPGTIALIQQPENQTCAILGDILATRLSVRKLRGAVADGRIRDLPAISELCKSGEFTVWSKGTSTVGTGLEAKAWACDKPMRIGRSAVHPGDILVADEAERGCVVIPKDQLQAVMEMLPGLKETDDRVVADVQRGVPVGEAFRRHRG